MLTLAPGFSYTEQFSAVVMVVLSMLSAIPATMMVLKLAGEEKANHTENLFARAVSRRSLMGGYLLIGIAVAFAMQLLAALGLWSAGIGDEDRLALGTTMLAAMAYAFLLVMVGLASLLVRWLIRHSLTWLHLRYSLSSSTSRIPRYRTDAADSVQPRPADPRRGSQSGENSGAAECRRS